MSYGSLGSRAVEALNAGAALAGCVQGTGEGGLTPFHQQGGDLVWQLGTGYFGCRDAAGHFDLDRFCEVVAREPDDPCDRDQDQPGREARARRRAPGGEGHPRDRGAAGGADGGRLRQPAVAHRVPTTPTASSTSSRCSPTRTGLPVGVKTAVGDVSFFRELARLMTESDRGIDFLTVDGGEGGTGAAPLAFADHVALPFKLGFASAYRCFAEAGITDRIVFLGSGRNGLPVSALVAFALGCDGVNVGREAMLSLGCIQAQRCHTGRCPTGVTTNSRWRQRGLDPALKSVRCANYIEALRRELLELTHACGEVHPALVTADHLTMLDENFRTRSVREVFGYEPGWGLPSASQQADARALMAPG